MVRLTRGMLLCVSFLATFAGDARADGSLDWGAFCTPGPVVACAQLSIETLLQVDGNTAVRFSLRNLQGSVAEDNTGGSAIQKIWGRRPCSSSCPMVSMPGGLSVDGSVGTVQYRPGIDFPLWDHGWTASGLFDWSATFYEASPRIFGCDPFRVPATGSLMPAYAINGYTTCARDGLGGAIVFGFVTPGPLNASDILIDKLEFQTASGQVVGCSMNSSAPRANTPCVSVPEPSSLLLLASGAVGVLGVGWRRRRAA